MSAHDGRSVRSGLLASLAALVLLAAVEVALRLVPAPAARLSPAVFLDRQGGLEEIERSILEEMREEEPDALRVTRIYREDEATFWRLRSNAAVEAKNYLVPRAVRDRAPFAVTLNARGLRGPLLPRAKPPGALRVIAVGNSSTFGWGVSDAETYPAQLETLLAAAFPGRRVEVMNAGIPGFSSFQGRRLIADELLPLSSDYVILSFGFNDSRLAASSDSAFARERARPIARLARAAGRLETYRRLAGVIRGARSGDRLSPAAEERTGPRVPVAEYAANMRAMIAAVRAASARPILLAMAIPQEYRDALVAVARETSAPILETRPYLLARVEDADLRARRADAFARHADAWRGVPPGIWRSPAYADATHPSGLGHALIAEWVARVIGNEERRAVGAPASR
jgi:lysophospholipase L1-like esterase